MTTPNQEKINSLKSNLFVWFFPVVAVIISGWLMADYVKQRGPAIEISFDDGSAIQAEKTRVRYRGVTIGVVKDMTISEDGKEAIAHVRLQKDAAQFAVEGSKFWVVSPKVGFQGITGLETIFEGTYIAVQPGPADGDKKLEFKGKLEGQSNDALADTISYVLETNSVESVTIGNAVTFRGLNVGSVTKVTLSKTGQSVFVQINVQNHYAKLIRANTVFWRKVGIQANLGLFNSEIKMNSMDSILHGGIEFFTPDPAGEVAKSQAHFNLVAAAPKGWEKWNPKLE